MASPQGVIIGSEPGHAATGRSPLVCLLGAPFDTGNLGVNALASGTLAALRAGLPRSRVFLLDYRKRPIIWTDHINGEEIPVELVNLRFSKWIWLPNNIARLILTAGLIRLVPVRRWRRGLSRRNRWLRRIAEPDFHLSLAGGDSFSDLYGLSRLLYTALPKVLVLLLEKPLILLPQTYGPFKGHLARAIARGIFRRAHAIYSRDAEGLKVVAALAGGRGPAPQLAYDMGFGLEPVAPRAGVAARLQGLKTGPPIVGINVSGLLYASSAGTNRFGLKSEYMTLVHSLLDLFIDRHGLQVLLIPHVRGKGAETESDLEACRQVALRLGTRYDGSLHYIEGELDQHETKYVIGQCDFFCGSRMHACIAAVSQGVPAVGLAYSRKFFGVMELVGEGAAVADLRTLGREAVVAAVEAAWHRREAMRRLLSEKMPAIRQSVLGFFRQAEFQGLFNSSTA